MGSRPGRTTQPQSREHGSRPRRNSFIIQQKVVRPVPMEGRRFASNITAPRLIGFIIIGVMTNYLCGAIIIRAAAAAAANCNYSSSNSSSADRPPQFDVRLPANRAPNNN